MKEQNHSNTDDGRIAALERQLAEAKATIEALLAEKECTTRLESADASALPESIRRSQAEEAARESEVRFRTLADSMPQLVWMAKPDGTVDYYNRRVEEYAGIAPVEGDCWQWAPVLHPEDVQPTVDAWNHSVQNGVIYQIEHRVRMAGGSYRWHLSRGFPVRDREGKITRWYGTATDIQNQKESEEKLREAYIRLSSLVDANIIGVIRGDKDGQIVEANDYYLNMLGFTRQELEAGQVNWKKQTPPAHIPITQNAIAELEKFGTASPYEKEYIRKDGERVWALINSTLLPSGEIVAYVLDISERKQSEEALRESEQRYRIAVDNAPAVFAQTDRELRYRWIQNPPAGFFEERVIGKRDDELEDTEHNRRLLALKQKVLESGKSMREEIAFHRPEGVSIFDITCEPLYDADGQIAGVSTAGFDITDRKRMEHALRESEERYRFAARATNDAIWDWDLTTDAIQWNESLTDRFGYPPSEQQDSSGRWWKAHIHPDDRAFVIENLNEAIYGESDVWTAEYRFRRMDGSYAEITDRGCVVRDDNGRPVRMVGAMRDVTLQNRAEDALRESEERFRTMANNIPQLAWMTDAAGWFFWYNQRWFDYTGTTIEEMQDGGWQKVLHPEHGERVSAKLRESFRTGQVWEDAFPLRGKDGQYRWFLSQAVPIRNKHGDIIRWFGTNTDITELKRLQEENHEQKDLLERMMKSVPVGIAFLKGPQHVYYLANDEYRHMARGKGELVGTTVAEKWPEIAGTVIPQMDQVYRSGEAFSIKEAPLNIVRDGVAHEEFYSYTFTPIYKADGSIEGVMILALDTTAAVRDRQAVEAQSARLETVLQSLPVGVWIADPHGQLIGKNEQADLIWRGDAPLFESIEQYPQYKAWHMDTGQSLRSDEYPMAKALLTGQPVDPVEMRIRRFDGSEGSILVSAAPILDREGQILGAVALNMDITERKQAEDALRESEARFRAVLENSIDVAYRRNLLTDSYDYLSPVMEKVTGYTPEEVSAMTIQDALEHAHPDDREAIQQELERAAATGTGKLEYRFRTKAGEYRWMADYVTVEKDDGGRLLYRSGIMRDITERKQVEQALRESENRLRFVVENSPDNIFIQDRDLRYVWVGRPAPPFTLEEYIGHTDFEMVSDEDAERLAQIKRQVLETGQRVTVDMPLVLKGELKYFEGTYEPWRDPEGRVIGLAGYARDITGRKRNEEALRRLNESLEKVVLKRTQELRSANAELIEMRKRLMDSVEVERLQVSRELHDGPMQDIYAILYNLAGMEGNGIAPDVESELVALRDQLNQVNQTLRGISRDLLPPSLKALGLEKSIREHIRNIRQARPSLGIRLKLMPDGLLLTEEIRLALYRIYQTAMGNVLRHSQADRVSVRLLLDAEEVSLEIEDNGVGFKVPGRWIEFARKGHLGLAGAYDRADNIGGALSVESAPGKGTRVRVVVPLADTDSPDGPAA